MNFPKNCIRGLRKANYVTREGKASAVVFLPDERTANDRTDGGSETSINWEDDGQAVILTLREYQNGCVFLDKNWIDLRNASPGVESALSYERAQLTENPYHGNIVYRADLSMPTKRMIAAALALDATKVINKAEHSF